MKLESRDGLCNAAAATEGASPLCRAPAVLLAHVHERQGQRYPCTWIGYCDAHGGRARAGRETLAAGERCWHTLAPPELSRDRVDSAGALGLSSEHAYVVVRSDGGRWKTALGIGSHLAEEPGAYDDPVDAEAVGLAIWRRRLTEQLHRIREARGGSLDWGRPVQPRELPEVLLLEPGEVAWEHLDRVRPPLAEALVRKPPLALSRRDRDALEWVRGGHEGPPSTRARVRQLLARARDLGHPLEDETALLARLSSAARVKE